MNLNFIFNRVAKRLNKRQILILVFNGGVTMFSQTKNSSGFTLVELMVVVAIIGILSAIAVPNFKKYQAKSKQSEAKIQLAAVYNTEVAAQADYDSYATCLTDIGYEISPKGYYKIGFGAAFTTGVTARGGSCAATVVFTPSPSFLKANSGTPTYSFTVANTATSATFTAQALGNIRSSDTAVDSWIITETKALSNDSPNL